MWRSKRFLFVAFLLADEIAVLVAAILVLQALQVPIPWPLLAGIGAALIAVSLFLFRIFGSLQRTPVIGIEALVGQEGEVFDELNPEGLVRVHGELWKAESLSGRLVAGDRVVVMRSRGLKLLVQRRP
jgi:membrane-bound serine protease (ClpP class)